MGEIKVLGDEVFRDFQTAGVPASGVNEPAKSEIRNLVGAIDARISGAVAGIVYYATGAQRIADTAQPIGTLGKAADEADYYRRSGDGWVIDNTVYAGVAALVQPQLDALEASKATKDALQAEFDGRVAADEAIYEAEAAKNEEQDAKIATALVAAEGQPQVFDPGSTSPMAPSYVAVTGKSAPRYDDVIDAYGVGGQSLAGGATVGPAVATTSLYPGRALMPADMGVRVTAGWRFAQFADAVETYNGTSGEGETITTSMLSHLIQANDAITGAARRKIVGFVSAVGGTAFADLRRGSFPFQNFLDAVEDATAIARASGYRLRVPGYVWIQGQNETSDGTTAEQYFNMLRSFARDLGDDVMQITGQHERPMLYIVQTSTVNNALGLDQQVQMAQLRAGRTDWARVVCPLYHLPSSSSSGADSIHKNGAGTNLMGQLVARATFAESQGLGWQALSVRSARLTSSTKILIDCDVPVAPIVIDTTGAVNPAGLQGLNGFDVQLPNGTYATIASMAVVNSTSIELTMSAPITAAWVRVAYAMRRNAGTTDDTPSTGARGCVRDSATGANLYGLGTPANWLLHWTDVIPAASTDNFTGPLVAGVWHATSGLPRLLLNGTGTVTIDARNSAGTVTAAVFSATLSGAVNQVGFPYFGADTTEVRAAFTGSATAEII